jgi:hypothetical protein
VRVRIWCKYRDKPQPPHLTPKTEVMTIERQNLDPDSELVLHGDDMSLAEREANLGRMAGQDRLRALALGVVSELPLIGGPLAHTLENEIPSNRERRTQAFLERLAGVVDAHEERLATLERPSEGFADVFEAVLLNVPDTPEPEKLQAYAAIVVNSIHAGDGLAEERLMFVDLVERSRAIHLRMLSAMAWTQGVVEGPAGWEAPTSRLVVLKTAVTGYDEEILVLAWNDLVGWGLLSGAALNATVGAPAARNLRSVITPLGLRFLDFITA